MIGGSADIDICKIPLSNDTIHRRIKDMSENIEQNTAKTLANSNFALQVDETTDITGNAQLIAFVRFIHENDIINQFLCCRELPDFTTGKHIFQVISSYLEEIKVSWKSCIGICTDGAPAMTGHLKGFVAHVKELNENILVTHCFLHREALVIKFLPSDLKIVLEQCVKMVNYIKSRPLKSRLFSKLCQAMEAKYESLLLHTEVRWLSRGKVISRVLKLKDEMKIFFEQNKNYEFVHLLEDKIWCTKLAYLSDIFVIFNNINSSMQGPNENILNSNDKLVGFKKQITLWKNKVQEGNLEKFESVPKDSYKTIKLIVVDHLTTLEERIIHYFPKLDIKKFDWKKWHKGWPPLAYTVYSKPNLNNQGFFFRGFVGVTPVLWCSRLGVAQVCGAFPAPSFSSYIASFGSGGIFPQISDSFLNGESFHHPPPMDLPCPGLATDSLSTYYEQDYPYTILFEPNFGAHIPRSFGKTVLVFTSHLNLTWDKGVELRFFQVGRSPSHRVWEAYQPHITDAYSVDLTDCLPVADMYVKWLTWLDDWEMHRDDPVPWRIVGLQPWKRALEQHVQRSHE
ncbi:SCAN domain-containing protein 3 [Trichonephila clavipes]|nr:SCAN domain-containing protein 3 [Trichonephila clavipes]